MQVKEKVESFIARVYDIGDTLLLYAVLAISLIVSTGIIFVVVNCSSQVLYGPVGRGLATQTLTEAFLAGVGYGGAFLGLLLVHRAKKSLSRPRSAIASILLGYALFAASLILLLAIYEVKRS